ncbi:hypothetical protein L207DRAFT_578319 [Hyaloscypha variabilis F]|uniref:Uncharacterized protein n=1 Tax=Hyaloscypha variabilis (strain UAMH 11265 / GT02V1 / F) TaxID=1149755 RepID=A0A2J6S3P9_HYAVF|nr:hypothetical protein L207DRAFT_578319 [Hyaloscypha variabilis F]
MHLSKLASLSLLAAVTQAGSFQSLSPALAPRTPSSFTNTNGIVIMCTEANWKGSCITLTVPTNNTCITLPPPFFHNVSSIEPAFGTVCYRYAEANCADPICTSPTGCDMMIQFPGFADLSTQDSNWEKKIGGLECEVDFSSLGI